MIEPHFQLLQLIPNGIRAFITAERPDLGATVAAGWKARARNVNRGAGGANRIVFTPAKTFAPLPVVAPGEPGGDEDFAPRELLAVGFKFDVSFWGYDATSATTPGEETDDNNDTGRDMRHVSRALELFTLASQALQHNAWGVYDWGAMGWTDHAIDERFGAELNAELIVRVPILDVAPTHSGKPVAGSPRKGPSPFTDH